MIWIGAGILMLLGSSFLFQRRLIYFPTDDVAPIDALLPGWTEETITTSDGLDLTFWFRAPPPDAPVVVVFPGNAGNRSHRAPLGARLESEGFGVMLVDYRGYGGNPGRPTEDGLALDARAVADFVLREAPGHPVIYFGESLGAAVALELAVDRPPLALVLRSPFTSLAAVAAHHYPLLPTRALLRDIYPSDERAGAIQSPTLIVYGTADTIVPADQSRALATLFEGGAQTVAIEGADHNDFDLLAGDEMVKAIGQFIGEVTTR